MSNNYDLIIVGAGIMASSLAYNLYKDGYTGKIALFEKDNKYEYSSTPRSEGGIRQTFSTEVNIRMSQYSYQVYKKFEEEMAFDGENAQINFNENGYLYLLDKKSMPIFEDILKTQETLGVKTKFMNQRETQSFFPELNVEDLVGSVFDPEAGNADPYSVLQAYIRKIREYGVSFIYEEVDTILTERNKAIGIQTTNGDKYFAPIVVNAAGPWSGDLSAKIGLEIPVKPLRRQLFSIDTQLKFQHEIPFTFDPTGLHFRSERSKVVVGWANDVPYGYDFNLEKSFFEEEIWPVLATRSSHFEQLKLENGWTGLYDYNYIDQNAIIGGHPDLGGYFIVSGFSGHGFQHAPAAGKALSELIRLGKFETMDISSLSVERFKTNELVIETAVY
ncbi:FAD-dependent oxidoreductase [Sporosarcina ureae]|uniref:NAD(P)/FAD-dependent oxidoreductase n=1 Tax=Sporosarcina TaxID=1569 RepID=UPI000A15242A|nr:MULTISPECIES: FAD-binding oxidoreductase [Sporosarcina]ARJ37716.1 FAD-dependent oxidoreductase [Sporosarcina ureae]PIC82841.1 FAD-binding oxidoreductase [Sporosarcina sp. P1]